MARNWSAGEDDSGQISLDFLIGFGVFALAIIFVFAYITGLFVPFVSNSDEVTMAADRMASILVDDVLAVNSAVGVQPGILDDSKIYYLNDNVTDNTKYDKIRASLGLNRSGNSLYSLEVIIAFSNGTTIDIINSGDRSSTMTGNIGQSKRFVIVRDPTNSSDYPGSMAILRVRVW